MASIEEQVLKKVTDKVIAKIDLDALAEHLAPHIAIEIKKNLGKWLARDWDFEEFFCAVIDDNKELKKAVAEKVAKSFK